MTKTESAHLTSQLHAAPSLRSVEELFSQYWDIGYWEGQTGGNQHEQANAVLSKLRALFAATTQASTAQAEELLALHRRLASERLRADQGWARAEGKSNECAVISARLAEARDAALEEAARICDAVNNHDNPMTARDCADAIRALRSAGDTGEQK